AQERDEFPDLSPDVWRQRLAGARARRAGQSRRIRNSMTIAQDMADRAARGACDLLDVHRVNDLSVAEVIRRHADPVVRDSERIEWLDRHLISLHRHTSPSMDGTRVSGQFENPAWVRGE